MNPFVLGIDPGPSVCGWMVLEATGKGGARYVAGGMVAANHLALVALANLYPVQIAAIERPRFHAIRNVSPLVMRAMAQQLIETTYVAGRIIQLLRDRDDAPLVLEMPAGVWRKGLLGKGASTNAAVKAALAPLLQLPAKTNEHSRDAGGVALAAVRLIANGAEGGPYGRSAFDSDNGKRIQSAKSHRALHG